MVDEVTLDAAVAAQEHRRRTLWSVLAVLVVLGASLAVVAASRDDGAGSPALPVSLDAPARGAASELAGDSSMPAWITYLPGDGLPALGGEAAAYRLSGALDEGRIQQVADALGIGGTVGLLGDTSDARQGPWKIEGEDGALEVFGGSWWYRGHPAMGGGAGCEPRPDLDCPHGAEPPAPADATDAAKLPNEDEARSIALDLLAATGLDVSDAVVTVDGPYEAWYVDVEPRLAGVPAAGWLASVAVGPDGVIMSASGHLSEPELLGDYALLDTRATIDRLNEQSRWSTYAPTVEPAQDQAIGGQAVAPAAGCVADPASTATTECDDVILPSPWCEVLEDPAGDPAALPACEPVPPPEPTEVVLTTAGRVLVMMPAVDGSGDAYLVPGYRFTGDDGTVIDVPAIADESLIPTPSAPTGPPPEMAEPVVLAEGEPPALGVPYYVDVDVACGAFELGGRIWMREEGSLAGWSEPHEGGMFTLDSQDHGTFVGDAEGAKTATFAAGTAGNGCTPTPRS